MIDGIDWNAIMKAADRREMLGRNIPPCPSCSARQVELVDWFNKSASWRCRKCKQKFYYEPRKEDLCDLSITSNTRTPKV